MEQFDCRGLACPQPVMRTRDALAAGTNALEVLVDNEPARENVRRFLEGRGFTVAASQEGPDCWRITASAGESAASAPQQATEASRPGAKPTGRWYSSPLRPLAVAMTGWAQNLWAILWQPCRSLALACGVLC